LQIRWTAVDVVEPWRACCDRPTRYTSGTIAGPGLYKTI